MSDLTRRALQAAAPRAGVEHIDALTAAMDAGLLDTPRRAASFASQCAWESAGFTQLVESLDYSVDALRRVFPRYMSAPGLAEYLGRGTSGAAKQQLIAEIVYGNRMGNGAPGTGDGWKYRGRAYIQTTGLDNYKALMERLQAYDLVGNPALALRPDVAAAMSVEYWRMNDLNRWADQGNNRAVSAMINTGSASGVPHAGAQRDLLYSRVLAALGAT